MEVQEVKEQLKAIFRTVINNDKWITIHPNGEDGKGKHLLLKDGESPKEAIERVYKKEDKKEEKKEYPSRHAEILYKDLPELREKLHKARYERAKHKEKGADVSLYDKRIKEYEEKEQQLKDEMADLRDSRRTQKERYVSLIEENKANNDKEQEMALLDELKKLITKVENTKGEKDMEIENEKVDKRKLIDEVAGIMKSAGCDDEDIRTAIGKMEKIGYDDSEKSADNEKEEEKAENCGKKVKNEDEKDEKEVKEVKEEIKEDVDNKCKNSVDNSKEDYFAKLNEIYNAASQAKEEVEYTSRADREKAAEDYFAK